MATATSRRAAPSPNALKERRMLSQELLGIARKQEADNKRAAQIEADLKIAAKTAGGSFKEDFGADGYVSASGPVESEFKGDVPVIQTEKWNALKPAERKALEKSGLIKVEPQWGRASSGRVTVKVL